jgi:hypothetical protein
MRLKKIYMYNYYIFIPKDKKIGWGTKNPIPKTKGAKRKN